LTHTGHPAVAKEHTEDESAALASTGALFWGTHAIRARFLAILSTLVLSRRRFWQSRVSNYAGFFMGGYEHCCGISVRDKLAYR
jgi:hypothetical protein